MGNKENFVKENFSTYLYFYMGFVDADLVDDLEQHLYQQVVNVRKIKGERLYVGYKGDCNCADVIRYEIPLVDATPNNVEEIKQQIIEHTNTWVSNMGGKDSVY